MKGRGDGADGGARGDREVPSLLDITAWGSRPDLGPGYRAVLQSFSVLPPEELRGFLVQLGRAELAQGRRPAIAPERDRVVCNMRLAPALEGRDIEGLAQAHVDWLNERTVDVGFLSAYSSDFAFLSQLVDLKALQPIVAEHARGANVVVAGFHLGSSEISIGGLAAAGLPLTVLSSFPKDRPGPAYLDFLRGLLPDLDLDFLNTSSRSTMLRSLRQLRKGRVVMVYPEWAFGFAKLSRSFVVPFLGTEVRVPVGLGELVAHSDAAVFGCAVCSLPGARFGFETMRLKEAGATQTAAEVTARAMAFLDRLLIERGPERWELWQLFDRMLATSS
jgi:lauroyl/myristoyl acyltransferase